MLRVGGGDDSTYLKRWCVHAAASRTCVGLEMVPPDSGASADAAVTPGLCEDSVNGPCCSDAPCIVARS